MVVNVSSFDIFRGRSFHCVSSSDLTIAAYVLCHSSSILALSVAFNLKTGACNFKNAYSLYLHWWNSMVKWQALCIWQSYCWIRRSQEDWNEGYRNGSATCHCNYFWFRCIVIEIEGNSVFDWRLVWSMPNEKKLTRNCLLVKKARIERNVTYLSSPR